MESERYLLGRKRIAVSLPPSYRVSGISELVSNSFNGKRVVFVGRAAVGRPVALRLGGFGSKE
jgi:hypothetical protein